MFCSLLAQVGGSDGMRYRSVSGGQKRRRVITCGLVGAIKTVGTYLSDGCGGNLCSLL